MEKELNEALEAFGNGKSLTLSASDARWFYNEMSNYIEDLEGKASCVVIDESLISIEIEKQKRRMKLYCDVYGYFLDDLYHVNEATIAVEKFDKQFNHNQSQPTEE